MLYIDNKELNITKSEIYVGRFINHGEKGHNICIKLEFYNEDNGNKGYLNLTAGFEKSDDICAFIDREFIGVPFDHNDNQHIFFEVFDTDKFLDTEIESRINLKLEDIRDNKFKVNFEINDALIKIKFDGVLNVIKIAKYF